MTRRREPAKRSARASRDLARRSAAGADSSGVAASITDVAALRLTDRVRPGVRVLFVGINPGVRSAITNHHFAGYSNRFWKVLFDAGLVPEPVTFLDDDRLPEWGYGVTNLIPRPSPGIDSLTLDEYAAGLVQLRRKVRRWKPHIVAFVGVTLYRFVFAVPAREPVTLGPQSEHFQGARVFALPNPSGRNANFSYAQMVEAFARLKDDDTRIRDRSRRGV